MRSGALAVFDAAVLGPLRHAWGRTFLAIVAIALGVALGLAIHLINRIAADEMGLAARSLFGQADLAVEGAGFDESLYPVVARLPGIEVASPVVQVEAKLIGARGALTVLGMDVFQSRRLQPAFAQALAGEAQEGETSTATGEPIFLSASAAQSLRLEVGASLALQAGAEPVEFAVAGILPSGLLADRAAVLDIASTQWLFDRLGTLSRINLRLSPGTSIATVQSRLEAVLPPDVRVVTPAQAEDDAASLTRAYRSNLTALALVALFTGAFFVYSTQSLATLRRRREFALLHALGVTRRGQASMCLATGAMIGLAGSLLGVALGVVIARLGLQSLGTDLGAGFFSGAHVALRPALLEIVAFCVLGTAVSIAGSVQPALEAARIPTATALKAVDVASASLQTRGWLVLTLFTVAALVLLIPPVGNLPLPGYVSIALLILGTVAAMPAILRALLSLPLRARSVTAEIAMAQLRGTSRYASLSVAAIVVSFSLMVAMAIMVASFRHSLDAWTQRILPADLYLRSGYVGQSAHLTPDMIDVLAGIDAIERIEVSRFAEAQVAQAPVTLIARDLDPDQADRSLWLEAVTDERPPTAAIAVWISEAVADRHRLEPGDSFEMSLAGASAAAWVQGIWRDYEHTRGAIVMQRATYLELTGDEAVNTVWFWLRSDSKLADVQQQIRTALPQDIQIDMSVPAQLRRLSLQAFDRTFAVTYVLEVIAILIGLFGISAGTSAQVLARRREFGVLRHIGFTRAQIAATLGMEGAGLGALGVVAGLLTGGAVSLILIYVVNRQSFHWSMDLTIPILPLSILSAALVLAAAGIAILSGRQAMRSDVIAAVKEDW